MLQCRPTPTRALRGLTVACFGLLFGATLSGRCPTAPEQPAPVAVAIPTDPPVSAAPPTLAAAADVLPAVPDFHITGWKSLLPMGNLAGWNILRGRPRADDGLLDMRPDCLIERPLPCRYYVLCGEVRIVYGDVERSNVAGLIATRLFLRDDRRLPAAVLDPVDDSPPPTDPICLVGEPYGGIAVDSPDYFRPRENLLPVGEWRAFVLWVSADEVDFLIDDNLLLTSVSYGWALGKIRLESEMCGSLQFRNLYYRDEEAR